VTTCDTVLVGSYPPFPGPASAASVAAVKREWDAGRSVVTASYRTGAAKFTVPVAGPLAGWRLEQLRRVVGGPPRIVLGVLPGAPFVPDRRPLVERLSHLATATGLRLALRRFSDVTILVTGEPGVGAESWRVLRPAATRFIVSEHGEAAALSRLAGVQAEVVAVAPFPAQPAPVLYEPGSERALVPVDRPFLPFSHRARRRYQRARNRLLGRE
jgi:hypothetical protein